MFVDVAAVVVVVVPVVGMTGFRVTFCVTVVLVGMFGFAVATIIGVDTKVVGCTCAGGSAVVLVLAAVVVVIDVVGVDVSVGVDISEEGSIFTLFGSGCPAVVCMMLLLLLLW